MSKPLGGGAATPAQRQHARDILAASADQLTNVRAAAGRWQAGLAGLTGTIAIFGLVRGRDDVAGLPPGGEWPMASVWRWRWRSRLRAGYWRCVRHSDCRAFCERTPPI